MKKTVLVLILALFAQNLLNAQKALRVNLLGYLPDAPKYAVYLNMKEEPDVFENFSVKNAFTDEVVLKSPKLTLYGDYHEIKTTYRLNFSELTDEGNYYIQLGDCKSKIFRISKTIYDGAADYVLNFFRASRCGYNPVIKSECHQQEAIVVGDSRHKGKKVDVTGGWHNGHEYIQYVSLTATTVFKLLFAYEQNPGAFSDEYNENAEKKPNGIPDVLDEAKWGMDWLLKMNPAEGIMYHQVGDDRSKENLAFPNRITKAYGGSDQKPVYLCTGKPQGSDKYKNKSNGFANIAGKFSSTFAMGARILKKYYPKYAEGLKTRAFAAYSTGKKFPGSCQSVPYNSPHYLKEKNWVDDMELAAIQLYFISKDKRYLKDAIRYGKLEPVTGWIALDSVPNYQYFPFVNIGHFYLAAMRRDTFDIDFLRYLKGGIGATQSAGQQNAFYIGVEPMQNSNNLIAAMATQVNMYYKAKPGLIFKDTQYALYDWLLGCNPWGKTMVVGLPSFGDYPKDTHHPFSRLMSFDEPWGGLARGGTYQQVFNKYGQADLAQNALKQDFQTKYVIYNDNWNDELTNSLSLEGTSSLVYMFSLLEQKNMPRNPVSDNNLYENYVIFRGDTTKKALSLVFLNSNVQNYAKVNQLLLPYKAKASFMLTANSYNSNATLIKQIKKDGHYLGSYIDSKQYKFEKGDEAKIVELQNQLIATYQNMNVCKIKKVDAPFVIVPFDDKKKGFGNIVNSLGLKAFCPTPGTGAQLQAPLSMTAVNYSNEWYLKHIKEFEEKNTLNGTVLVFDLGANEKTSEEVVQIIQSLIKQVIDNGYSLERVDKLLSGK